MAADNEFGALPRGSFGAVRFGLRDLRRPVILRHGFQRAQKNPAPRR